MENGDLYVFGDNRSGQLGLGDRVGRDRPILNKFFESLDGQIKQISVGSSHSMVLVDEFI